MGTAHGAHAALLADLRGSLSDDRVRDGAAELSLYRHDAGHMQARRWRCAFR